MNTESLRGLPIFLSPFVTRQGMGENVAVNRGMKVKVFATLEEPFKWLELPNISPAGP
jgi:hypothetical protein